MKPSTIALAVMTCGLFGVAAWKHLEGTDTRAERTCADQHPEIAAQIAGHMAREAAVPQLVGANVAPGTAFAGIEVGAPVVDAQRAELSSRIHALGFELQLETAGDDVLDAMHVSVARPGEPAPACEPDPLDACSCFAAPDEQDICGVLSSRVSEAWGVGTMYGDQRVWFDVETQRRTRLADCTLSFERAVAPAAWIDWTEHSVIPLRAIGKPAGELGTRANELRSKAELRWTGPGIGIGSGQTRITGYLNDGGNEFLIGIRATGEVASGAMYDQLAQQISEVAGSVPTPIGRLLTWSGKVPITLGWEPGTDSHIAVFTLDAGSSAAWMIAHAKAP